ncbi:MAG: hypothetical protein NC133_03800, partial [Prevotella sp.]|nr:hypothetical protein [Prevotella sp.]
MGNKRKASIIILSVLIAAVAVFTGAYDLFQKMQTDKSFQQNTGVAAADSGSVSGSTDKDTSTNHNLDTSLVYMLYFAGGRGGGSGGCGAACLAFSKGHNQNGQYTNYTKSSGYNYGGGYTDAYSNFALPSDTSAGWARAGGGGGAGSVSSTNYHAVFCTDYGSGGKYGGSATQSRNGTGGSGNINGATWGVYSIGHSGNWREPDTVTSYTSAGGGNGYHVGMGGGAGSTSTYDADWYYHYSGGGGSCSPNCYPVYTRDSQHGLQYDTNGFFKYYRLTPYDNKMPSSKSTTLTTTTTSGTINPGGSGPFTPSTITNRIATAWVYRVYKDGAWSDWTTDVNGIAQSGIGAYSVQCKYVIYAVEHTKDETKTIGANYHMQYTSAAAAAGSDNYTICSKTVTLTIKGTATATAPTGKTLTYNGQAQQLLSKAGTATHGTMQYQLNSASDNGWTTSWSSLTATNAGTYTIYYRALGDTYYNNSSNGSITVTINKYQHTLENNSLASRRLIYTGNELQLYDGTASCPTPDSKGGKVYYGWANSSATGATISQSSTSATALKATDACDNSGNQYTYYLFYKVEVPSTNTNYAAMDWTYSGIATVIEKASYIANCAMNPSVKYDGLNHNLYENAPVVTADSGGSLDKVVVTYQRTFTSHSGVVVQSEETEDVSTLRTARDAGHYVLSVITTPKPAYRNHIKTCTTDLIFDIEKATNRDLAKLSGLIYNDSVTFELDITASAYPFVPYIPENQEFHELDLTVGGVVDYNGLTTNNPNQYNQMGYLLTRETGVPTDTTLNYIDEKTYGFIPISPNKLNETITYVSGHAKGIWYLWLGVVQHNSLTEDVKILAAQFSCAGFNDAKVRLSGITMTGAYEVAKDGSIPYDGLYHPLVKAGTKIEPDASQWALHFEDVYYGVSTSSNHAVLENLQWYDSLDYEVFRQKDVNTYYLWVKWGESDNLQGTPGVIYAHLEIKQLQVQTDASFYSEGINFAWGEPEINNTLAIYSVPFNNAEQRLGTIGESDDTALLSDIRTYNLAGTDLSADLIGYGELSFGVSTSSTVMNGVYYGWNEFKQVTVKNANVYYLWMSWPGSANVSAGAMAYCVKMDDARRMPCFIVEKLTDNTSTDLHYAVKDVNGTDEHPYAWQFVYDADSTTDNQKGHYQGVAQALFTTDVTPSISIGGYLYSAPSVTYQYMLSADGEKVTPTTGKLANNSGWVNSLDQAVMTDVSDYYLWVLVTVEDSDVALARTYLIDTAKIIKTESFVMINPRANAQEYTGHRREVFIPSGQDAPTVEYALFMVLKDGKPVEEQIALTDDEIDNGDDLGGYLETGTGWRWSRDVNAKTLHPIAAGLYKLYYRGAEYDTMFATQSEPNGGYPYIYVEVTQVGANISVSPTTTYVIYKGTPFTSNELFTEGFAKTTNYKPASETSGQIGKNNLPLLYSWTNKANEWYSYANLPQQVNAGLYVLYYKPDTDSDPDLEELIGNEQISTLAIQIGKANIAVHGPFLTGESNLPYKATGYQLFTSAVDYEIVDADNQPLKDASGTILSYKQNNAGEHGGYMGAVYYAVTMGARVYPTANDWT